MKGFGLSCDLVFELRLRLGGDIISGRFCSNVCLFVSIVSFSPLDEKPVDGFVLLLCSFFLFTICAAKFTIDCN